jgi:hypothetical protein
LGGRRARGGDVGRERAVDLGSGNGTPCGGSGGQLERITERDQDRRVVWPEERPPFPGASRGPLQRRRGTARTGGRTIVPWQATGTTGAPGRTAR